MSLSTEMETQGQWLFRWRSYLPFVFVPCLTWEVMHSEHDGTSLWWHHVWPLACWCVSVLGLLVRVHCVGHAAANTSGRNTRTQIADSLNVTGMYSVVRHPLYLGNFLIALGIVAHPASFWLIGLFVLSFVVYYERIMFAEEAFLQRKFGSAFTDWTARTPAFVPRVMQWVGPALPMNYIKAGRQESAAVAVITLGFLLLEIGSHVSFGGLDTVEPWWWVLTSVGVLLYISLRLLKRMYRSRVKPQDASQEMSLVGATPLIPIAALQSVLDCVESPVSVATIQS